MSSPHSLRRPVRGLSGTFLLQRTETLGDLHVNYELLQLLIWSTAWHVTRKTLGVYPNLEALFCFVFEILGGVLVMHPKADCNEFSAASGWKHTECWKASFYLDSHWENFKLLA